MARSNVEVVTTSFQHFVESGEILWEFVADDVQDVQGIGSRVLVLGRMKARGASGVAVERDDGIVYELREGQIVRLDYFNDQSLARTTIDAASGRTAATSSKALLMRSWCCHEDSRALDTQFRVIGPRSSC